MTSYEHYCAPILQSHADYAVQFLKDGRYVAIPDYANEWRVALRVAGYNFNSLQDRDAQLDLLGEIRRRFSGYVLINLNDTRNLFYDSSVFGLMRDGSRVTQTTYGPDASVETIAMWHSCVLLRLDSHIDTPDYPDLSSVNALAYAEAREKLPGLFNKWEPRTAAQHWAMWAEYPERRFLPEGVKIVGAGLHRLSRYGWSSTPSTIEGYYCFIDPPETVHALRYPAHNLCGHLSDFEGRMRERAVCKTCGYAAREKRELRRRQAK